MSLKNMLEAAAKSGSIEVDTGWTQGRAIYGGLTGALLLSAIKGRLRGLDGPEAAADAGAAAEPPPLRSLTVSFIGPATPGPVELTAEVLRKGKNVTQCQASMRQGDELVAVALASFGAHRESALTVAPSHPAPDLGDPADVEPFPYIEGMTPEFYRFLDLRQVGGALPFSGAETSGLSGWCALRETPEKFREEHLVAIADAWPPAPLQMVTGFAPASSLTWTIEFVAEILPDTVTPEGRFAYEVSTDAARDGYAHSHAQLWQPDGELVAISRQSITVYA